jgi:hypothetical protein
LHEHVITVYSGVGDWKRRVGHTKAGDDHAYLIVLDQSGIVRWIGSGPFDQARTDEVRAVVSELLVQGAQKSDVPAPPETP